MICSQPITKLLQGYVLVCGDLCTRPSIKARNLVGLAAMTLRFGSKRTRLILQLNHVVDEADRSSKMRSSGAMRVTFFDKRDNALAQLNWMWFAHVIRPFGNTESQVRPNGNPESGQNETALKVFCCSSLYLLERFQSNHIHIQQL